MSWLYKQSGCSVLVENNINILIYSYLLTNRKYYEFEKNGSFCSVCKGILSKEIRFRRDLLPHLDKRIVPDREFRAFPGTDALRRIPRGCGCGLVAGLSALLPDVGEPPIHRGPEVAPSADGVAGGSA